MQTTPISTPNIPVINNVDVGIEQDSIAIKNALIRQLDHPVRWVEIIQYLAQQSIDELIECGPGKILASLNKRITTIPTRSIQDPEVLQAALIS